VGLPGLTKKKVANGIEGGIMIATITTVVVRRKQKTSTKSIRVQPGSPLLKTRTRLDSTRICSLDSREKNPACPSTSNVFCTTK
jgi:hypothetical protein